MALDQQQRRSSAHMDALLSHEPSMLPQDTNLHGHQINPLYSNNSVSPSTTSNQSVHGLSPFNPKLMGCTDQIDTVLPSTSNFSKETASVEPKGTRKTSRNKQQQTQFRFKSNQSVKSNHKTAQSDLENKQKPLDINMLSQHNMQQEMTATRTITLGDTTFTFTIDSLLNTSKRKGKQKEHTPRRLSKIDLEDGMDEDDEYDEYDHQGSDKDEEEPIIGDGALSFSSIGSGNSYNSQKKSRLTKDDKRRRNTAASARFRIKKKMKEQALQKTAYDMTEKAQAMEHKVHELEREIKWLKALVVEKNESTLEELIRERPPNSIAFPLTSASNTSHQYDNQNIGKEDGYYSPC
ncbi:hypothetical protein BD560DRAFT_405949 [Blakeslea trispora]|nr:hypothetical protein BD560DRAFT_405949 [Blakeslea trispora]